MRTAFFTICTANYLAFARVLMSGVARHHPDAARYVVLADQQPVNLSADEFLVIRPAEIALPDLESFCFRYDPVELSTALKPYAILELFRRDFDTCIFFDPDIALYGALNQVFAALRDGSRAVLTPHRLTPGVCSGWPGDRDLLRVGAYNLGFLAVRRTREAIEVLEWWARRLERECLVALADGLFVDQKWMDLWPSFCPDTKILRHPGYNVAYWNLGERRIERTPDGYLVNGQALVFFHFSGVMPHRREVLSRHNEAFTAAGIGHANTLLQSYITEVLACGHADIQRTASSYALFENGVPIPSFASAVFRRDETRFPNPYRTVFQELLQPSTEISPNPGGVVSVAAHELWKLRDDLRGAFSMDTPEGQIGLATWFAAYGCAESGLDPAFAQPVAERLERLKAARASASQRLWTAWRRSTVLQRIWRSRPAGLRGGLRGIVLKVVSPSASPDAADAIPPPAPPSGPVALARPDSAPDGPLRPGALLVGYPKAETGVGQALRGLAQACREAAVPLGVFNFDLNVTARQADDSLSADITGSASHTCNLFCVNADQWPIVRRTLGEGFLARRYNILRPFWELARLPEAEALGLSGLQEIWAPTRFVAGAFKAAVSCPVEIIPVPVLVKPCAGLGRDAFGLPDGRFLFLFFFDFASFITRKNPEDIVAAFRQAFPDAAANVGLVIKAHGTGAFEDRRAWLAEQAADPRIVVLDRTMHRAEVDTLTSLADCFVSLHRSEGFGFGMAEAMALGKPVIGTDYSGNTDFLSETTGFPVSFRLVPVPSGTYPGHEDQVWAEPDLDEAAWLMRRVAAGEGNVAERVAAGRACMAENHSAAAVGRICRDRLERLGLIGPQAQ